MSALQHLHHALLLQARLAFHFLTEQQSIVMGSFTSILQQLCRAIFITPLDPSPVSFPAHHHLADHNSHRKPKPLPLFLPIMFLPKIGRRAKFCLVGGLRLASPLVWLP